MDLRRFTLDDLHRCSSAVRAASSTAPSSRVVAERVVSFLFDELRDPTADGPACPLVRLFRVVPCSAVSDDLDEIRISEHDRAAMRSGKIQKCLVLEASRGVRPEWNDPSQSVSHRVIPLSSPDALLQVPMVSALLSQLEVPPAVAFGPPIPTPDVDRLCNVFHVEDALDNPLVPDQESFVRAHSVCSVLGFGGLLPAGEAFATLLFSTVPITREAAAIFRLLAPSVRSALVAGDGAPMAIRVIIVGDEGDLLERTLRRAGMEPASRLVRSPAELTHALGERRWDLVLAQSVAGLGIRTAMTIVHQYAPQTPVIIVSPPTSDGTGAEAMKLGAHDFVTTDKLARLAPAIARELHAAEARRRSESAGSRLVVTLAVAEALSRYASLESATPELLRVIGSGLGWDVANFWTHDVEARVMRCSSAWQSKPASFPDFERLTFELLLGKGRGLPGRVWASGEAAWVTDVASDANSPPAAVAGREGLHAAFAFPVLFEHDVLGVFELLLREVRPPDGELLATMAAIGTQIGEFARRTRAFAKLEASDACKSATIGAAPDAIITMDAQGVVVELNPAAERTFGYRREEAVGSELAALIVPERLRDAHRRGLARFLASGVAPIVGKRLEMPGLRKNGTEFPAEITVVQVPASGPALFTGFVRDVSERKRAEEALENRRLLEEAQAAAHIGSWVSGFDERDRIHWSAETYRIFGVPETEALTFETFLSLVHPDDRTAVRRAREESVRRGEPFDIVHRALRPDGTVKVIHERATWAVSGTGRRMVGTAQDITEPRRISERDRMLAEASAQMTGVMDYPQILDVIAHVAVPVLADACVVCVADDRSSRGPRFVAHGAPQLDHRVRQVLADSALHLPVLLETLRSGNPRVFPPLCLPNVDELQHRAFQLELGASSVMSVPLRARGMVIGTVTLFRLLSLGDYDVFDLATAQDFASRAGLSIETARLYRQAQECARVRGEFLSIAAHELKTPVTPLKMQTQSLQRELASAVDSPPVRNLTARLAMIERSTGRLESLIDSLLDVSELAVGGFTPIFSEVDLRELAVEEAARAATDLESSGCSLTITAPEPVAGLWDRARMGRVIANLVSNAAKYGAGKPIEVTVRRHHASARLSVRDHGIGIARDEQARLFELFERVVPVQEYGGFGLGLWVVKQIIAAHGGHVFLWSRPGEGSEFTLELPLRPVEAGRSPGEAAPREERQAQA